MGIALVLVSIFYFNNLLFDSFGDTAVWAVMTVVVIFEFTAGNHSLYLYIFPVSMYHAKMVELNSIIGFGIFRKYILETN